MSICSDISRLQTPPMCEEGYVSPYTPREMFYNKRTGGVFENYDPETGEFWGYLGYGRPIKNRKGVMIGINVISFD